MADFTTYSSGASACSVVGDVDSVALLASPVVVLGTGTLCKKVVATQQVAFVAARLASFGMSAMIDLVQLVLRLRSVDKIRRSVVHGVAVTVPSHQSFRSRSVEYQGDDIVNPEGSSLTIVGVHGHARVPLLVDLSLEYPSGATLASKTHDLSMRIGSVTTEVRDVYPFARGVIHADNYTTENTLVGVHNG